MIKKIPFNLFEPDQYIYFDIPRLMELEKAIGRSLAPQSFFANPNLDFNETVTGLVIGLKHHYRQGTREVVIEKMTKCFEDTGKGIADFSELILEAIIASGVYGKKIEKVLNEHLDQSEKNA